jgi:hypothetical protein
MQTETATQATELTPHADAPAGPRHEQLETDELPLEMLAKVVGGLARPAAMTPSTPTIRSTTSW